MTSDGMSTRVHRGLAWLGIANSLVGVLDIVAMLVILNTWISAEEYGIATKCIWIFPILDQISDLGLSAALIQRDDHTPSRIATVFWINMLLSAALFGLLAAVAPVVAREFYGHAIVGSMLIAYGGKLLLQNGYFIPMAMLKRQLRFKELSIIKILANLAEFAGKVGFAAAGFGIWCFVLGPLARTVVYIVGTQARYTYRPRALFSLRDARDYVTFGLRSSGSQIMFYFYTNVDYPIVGYFFGDLALGLYRLAYDIVLEPVRVISNVVVDIAFPTFARLRGSADQLVAQLVSFTRLNLITVMTYAGIILVAGPDLLAVMFPGYETAADAARILCAVAVLRSVGFVIPPLLDGLGRPDRTLRYMAVAAVTLPLVFVLGAVVLGDRHGYEAVAVAWAVGYPIAFGVLVYLAMRTIGWTVGAFARSVRGVTVCLLAATATAAVPHYLLGGAHPVVRLLVTATVLVFTSSMLLAYTQGLSIRAAWRAVRTPL